MADEQLARIPFSRREEFMIISMSKWMKRFGMFMMAIGILSFGGITAGVATLRTLRTAQGLLEMEPLGISFLVSIEIFLAVWIFQGLVLFRAGRKFDLVGRTDEADQKYTVQGFHALKWFFLVEILFGLLGLFYSIWTLLSVK